MNSDFCCQAYTDRVLAVCRLRDFIDGEWRVKARGVTYLPKLDGQTDEDYDAYKQRTTFLNATARTHQGLVGQIFRKDPQFTVPERGMEKVLEDADTLGTSLYAYCRTAVSEVLATGRAATLVDWSDAEGRPALTLYTREAVLSWRNVRIAGRTLLGFVVLVEPDVDEEHSASYASGVGESLDAAAAAEEPGTRVRVLYLDEEGRYTVALYKSEQPDKDKTPGGQLVPSRMVRVGEPAVPLRNGQPLKEIPFVWHEPDRDAGGDPKPPLDDLCSLNLNHYRLSADHNHGLRFSTLPTPWVTGCRSQDKVFRIGSSVAWVFEDPTVKVGYLEASGAGLSGLKEKLESIEAGMAAMGARLLESQKREAESAEAMSLRQSGESSALSSLASSMSDSLSKALQWVAWWWNVGGSGAERPGPDKVSVELNTDFASARMTGDEVVQLTSSWIQGGISRDTLFYNLKRGEVVPPERTLEEELALVEEGMPKLTEPEPTPGREEDDSR